MRTARSEFVDYLMGEVAALKRTVRERDELIWKLISRPPQMIEKPLIVEQSLPPQPDLPAIARAMGEAFATTLNGSPQSTEHRDELFAEEALKKALLDMENTEGIAYPDVEFDEYMNPDPPEAAVPVGPFQTPVHAVIDGKLQRMDGTPMFHAGDGLNVPPSGGTE